MEIRIHKYDPAVDAKPYYVSHDVPFKSKMTLLEAIVHVHENFEAISYDYSCHGRMCGRCSVMLDGVPSLACCTPLKDEPHTIDPLQGHPVIRDLIVDKSDFDDKLSTQYLRVRTEPIVTEDLNEFDGEAAQVIYDLINCTRCGLCTAACPVHTDTPDIYVGPANMVALALRYYDTYDQADRVVEAVSNGLYNCILCGTCDEVCPRTEIEHVNTWRVLRAEAEARGLKPKFDAAEEAGNL